MPAEYIRTIVHNDDAACGRRRNALSQTALRLFGLQAGFALATVLLISLACGEAVPAPEDTPTVVPPTVTSPSPAPAATQQVKRLDELVQELGHEDPDVRLKAADSLGEMGPEAAEAAQALLDSLDRDDGIRMAVATTLAEVGFEEPTTFPALWQAGTEDESPVVQQIARLAFFDALARRRQDKTRSGGNRFEEVAVWGLGADSDVSFQAPNWLAIDSDDNVYVTEFNGNRVQKIGPDGTLPAQWGSQGDGDGQFGSPTGIAVDEEGNVFVSESGNHRVQKFSGDGRHLLTWGEWGSGEGQFKSAMGIVIDGSGRVQVADHNNHRIQVFDSDGSFLFAWGESGSHKGQFQNPIGLALDGAGNLYVADRGNDRVQKFTVEGEHIDGWGVLGLGSIPVNDAQAVTVGPSAEVLISSVRGGRVHLFSATGGEYLGTVGTGLAGPHGTAFGSQGILYVADAFNGVVRKFRPGGDG